MAKKGKTDTITTTTINGTGTTTKPNSNSRSKTGRGEAPSDKRSGPPVPPSPPRWPDLTTALPPCHAADLTLTEILRSQIYTIPDFFPPRLARAFVDLFARAPDLSQLLETTPPARPGAGLAARVNDRFQVDDSVFAAALWRHSGLEQLVAGFSGLEGGDRGRSADKRAEARDLPKGQTREKGGRPASNNNNNNNKNDNNVWGGRVIGLNPNIRVYRYRPGQFFARHYDDAVRLRFGGNGSDSGVRAVTTWTLLVYLSTCEGGQTIFYAEPPKKSKGKAKGKGGGGDEDLPVAASVDTAPGLALLHRHGPACLLHEGAMVTSGEKWVLRSDLVVVDE